MTKIGRIILLVVIGGGLILTLASCAWITKDQVAATTTDYNLAVEKAQNEILLLNIIRASKRRPMYFTGFNLVRGSLVYSVQTGGIKIPFGQIGTGLNDSYSIAPSIGYSNSPTFDLGLLDSPEFMNGFMSPVSSDLLEYYIHQGWRKQILLNLLIEKIELPGEEPAPPDAKEIERLSQCKLVRRDASEIIGPQFGATAVADVKRLVDIHKEKLTLTEVISEFSEDEFRDKYTVEGLCQQIIKQMAPDSCSIRTLNKVLVTSTLYDSVAEEHSGIKQDQRLTNLKTAYDKNKSEAALKNLNRATLEVAFPHQTPKAANREARFQLKAPKAELVFSCENVKPCECGAKPEKFEKNLQFIVGGTAPGISGAPAKESESSDEAKIYLRSPEGVLYYLGELMREDNPVSIQICNGKDASRGAARLFKVQKLKKYEVMSDKNHPIVDVEYDDYRYFIDDTNEADCTADRSMQVLSFVSQLIALQKKGEKPPTTGVVNVIGR